MAYPQNENRYDEICAAVLIGLAVDDLRRLARQAGVGRPVSQGSSEQFTFSYPELLQLSLLAARNSG